MAAGQRAAYRCQIVNGWLMVEFAAAPRELCATSVDSALTRLQVGEVVVVASGDMPALRTRLAGMGIG